MRLGDIVALRDILSFWGRGYYKGAITIGVIVHGASDYAGQRPRGRPHPELKGREDRPQDRPQGEHRLLPGTEEAPRGVDPSPSF
ncbi:DUF4438 domain-containing protein [Candidatus Bathyarchaeota archaeon]|nr:DUF4438 domain-containing protein [Candidatus Bathyarchaeota archaeon]